MKKLSVIIVSYNVRHYLAQCLLSVSKALKGIPSEVIVFDNASHDGTIEQLSPCFPQVDFIASNHNLGFAKGNNRAIQRSQGEYVLLLNPDTIVGERVFSEAVRFMDDHPKAGGVGVRMLKANGADAMESRRGIPTPMTSFYKMCGLCARFPQSRRFGRYYMGYLPWDKPARIEIISGAFCLLRRKALDQVGLLDEDFFMYGEDIDLSFRLLKGGWENWYLPLKILHYKGESTQKSSFRYVHVFYEAMLIFFRKHYGHLGWLLTIPIQFGIYLKATAALLALVLKKGRQLVGFEGKGAVVDPLYVLRFQGQSMEECRTIIQRRGLRAVCDTEVEDYKGEQWVYEVYDASSMAYEQMLDRISTHPLANASLATYYPDARIVITDDELVY